MGLNVGVTLFVLGVATLWALRQDAPLIVTNATRFCVARVPSQQSPDETHGKWKSRREDSVSGWKRWKFCSVHTPTHFLAAALVHFSYVSECFAYVVDLRTNRTQLFQARRPPGWNFGDHISMAQDPGGGGELRFAGRVGDVDFDVGILTGLDESLYVNYPLSATRTAYVHKAAGIRVAQGSRIGNASIEHDQEWLASLDWTVGTPNRITTWRWWQMSGNATEQESKARVRVGINLSNDVYGVNGDECGAENAVWLDGRVSGIPFKVNIEVPQGDVMMGEWRVATDASDDAGFLDLVAQPVSLYKDATSLLVVAHNFVQVVAHVRGTLRIENKTYTLLPGTMAVIEKHYALW